MRHGIRLEGKGALPLFPATDHPPPLVDIGTEMTNFRGSIYEKEFNITTKQDTHFISEKEFNITTK